MINFFWLYDLNIYTQFFLIVGFITITGLTKTFLFPEFFNQKFSIKFKHNEFIIGFLSLTGAFLSITIGLIIVGTYDNYEQTEDTTRKEVNKLYMLYKNIELLGDKESAVMLENLREYSKYVIHTEWKLQQKGIMPPLSNKPLNAFEEKLKEYHPKTKKDLTIYRKIIDIYEAYIGLRHYRISIVQDGLPASIYVILIFGLIINILISWLIVNKNKPLEFVVYTLTGLLAGILVFIIIAMDYPFRGEYSVTPEPFEIFLKNVDAP
jgi:F0F1-type ATP synthase assembly protein I